MWRNALCGTAIANFEEIKRFHEMRVAQSGLGKDICVFVVDGINALPWYLRVPLKTYAVFINVLCLMLAGHMLANMSSGKRQIIIKRIKIIPLFGIYNKLIRAKVFLRLFDSIPSS